MHQKAETEAATVKRNIAQAKLSDKQFNIQHMSRAVHDGNAQPLVALLRPEPGPNGEPKGSIATEPSEVDLIARTKWGRITRGNLKNEAANVRKFMQRYDKEQNVVYKSKPFKVAPITADDLMPAN